ncbi:SgcJ/EcaC family oxidoreductase [Streptomyces sp. NPDC059578]|uniref:SgcJ/EcaC family oxidoreductase n=1 Tax=unclassified Streptomyces TaxID=2593676 RepID=UPI003654738D
MTDTRTTSTPGTEGATDPDPASTTPDATAREADLAEIRRVVSDASTHQSDPERFLPLYTPDASVVNFGGRRVLGRDALEQAMHAALASPLAKVLTTVEILDIRFVRPDVAVVVSVKHVSDEREESEGKPLPGTSGSLTHFLEKSSEPDTGWRITHSQTTPILG